MNNNQVKCLWFYFSWIIVLMTCIQNSFAAEMDCEIGNKLADNIYHRAAIAWNNSDNATAFAIKDDFWDVYQYSSNCTQVKKFAKLLTKHNMGKDAKAPVDDMPFEIQKELRDLCTKESGCTIIVKGSGEGSVYQVPEIYQFSKNHLDKGTMKWKKLSEQDFRIIQEQIDPQFRFKLEDRINQNQINQLQR